MIRKTFLLLDKVGCKKERQIWQQGIHGWNDFLHAEKVNGISKSKKESHNKALEEAKKKLWLEDSYYFAQKLPLGEHWRLYDHFKEDTIFLDIETSGYYGDIVMIGMYDGYETRTFVKGFNLYRNQVLKALQKYKLMVTFNGASFDLPVIKKYFQLPIKQPHIDLRFLCQKQGLTGGLKAIEKRLGIKRRKEVEDTMGSDAVYLWQMWNATRKKSYLKKLVLYNEEDVINLKPLAEQVIEAQEKKIINASEI